MMAWISLGWAFAASAMLGLSMHRHQEQMLSRELGVPWTLAWRVAGYLGLGVALIPCLRAWSVSVAVAAWLGVLTAAAMALGALLAYAPRMALAGAGLAALASSVAWMIV
ncbi:hypothetical protein JL37_02430 [Achromobacter sp. RTa]|uniref:DUF3325 domain-containing protein n=1 Tax=Achromobacter sp. RTa TaxID=1532557 RepID=UPI0005103848|nr:DUF3325 domain-containing protein [Achromobacter sp. RTa]KGE00388.1 hypothetical protein JL37_02430 [Achromobacter sp. RTa]